MKRMHEKVIAHHSFDKNEVGNVGLRATDYPIFAKTISVVVSEMIDAGEVLDIAVIKKRVAARYREALNTQ